MQQHLIRFELKPDRLRISWDNREVRKDRFSFWFLLLFWVIWAPVTCFATVMIFVSGHPIFFTLWCVFGWLGTIWIPLTFVQRLWKEWIEVDAAGISWGVTGPLAGVRKPKTMPLARIAEFGLGLFSDNYEQESAVTLNVYEKPKRFGYIRYKPRHMLAWWLSKENKEVIFERIREFVVNRSIPLRIVTYQQGATRIVHEGA